MDLIKLIENYSKILKLAQEINNIELIKYANAAINSCTTQVDAEIKKQLEGSEQEKEASSEVKTEEVSE